MSIYGKAIGTEFEVLMKQMMRAEANGTMMYYALARLAKEQGYDDIVDTLIEAANQEAEHAAFYALTVGKYPQDFWGIIRTLEQCERKGEGMINSLADKIRAAGLEDIADGMGILAKQEAHHGELMATILAKYPDKARSEKKAGVTYYICPLCGYIHEGDINDEADDYECPVCGQPKKAFKEQK